MNFQSDLFSINNIIVPSKNKISGTVVAPKKEHNLISSNYVIVEQKKFESIDIISIDPKKIDAANKKILEKKYNKSKTAEIYKSSESFKEVREKNWHTYLYDRMKSSIGTRNKRRLSMYNKALLKYNETIANGFPAKVPIMKPLYDLPNFTSEFLLKLWEIQGGLDAYTNQPMEISSDLCAFKPSCDRISSNINYDKGNVVLCCYSTNQGKHTFDPFSDVKNNWMDYISNRDAVKKEEIRERIRRIQTLSME